MTDEGQSRYAIASARIELRLAELREALDRHEVDRANWTHADVLERVERGLAQLVEEVQTR